MACGQGFVWTTRVGQKFYSTGPFQLFYHRLLVMCPYHHWATFSATTAKCFWPSHAFFFMFLDISGWLNKLERERISCFILKLWSLFLRTISGFILQSSVPLEVLSTLAMFLKETYWKKGCIHLFSFNSWVCFSLLLTFFIAFILFYFLSSCLF